MSSENTAATTTTFFVNHFSLELVKYAALLTMFFFSMYKSKAQGYSTRKGKMPICQSLECIYVRVYRSYICICMYTEMYTNVWVKIRGRYIHDRETYRQSSTEWQDHPRHAGTRLMTMSCPVPPTCFVRWPIL